MTVALDPISPPASLASKSSVPACALCGSGQWQPHLHGLLDYLTDERFDIDRCRSCGLLVTRPMPSDAEIDRYYPPSYRGNRHAFTARLRVLLRCRAVERRFPRNFRGRLLDVGCGDGAFVLEMHRRGWLVCATEIDADTVRRLRAAGIDAKSPTDAERDGFGAGEKFDVVTSWHVLEHVARPAAVANWVHEQLRPGGVFLATVPNADCLQARLFGKAWLHFDVPRHRFHFSSATFAKLLQNAGFTIADRDVFAFEYDWFGVIQSVLNLICRQRNVLFDRLTCGPGQDCPCRRAPFLDKMISSYLCVPLAAISLPPLLLDWAAGDGASLTLVAKIEQTSKRAVSDYVAAGRSENSGY